MGGNSHKCPIPCPGSFRVHLGQSAYCPPGELCPVLPTGVNARHGCPRTLTSPLGSGEPRAPGHSPYGRRPAPRAQPTQAGCPLPPRGTQHRRAVSVGIGGGLRYKGPREMRPTSVCFLVAFHFGQLVCSLRISIADVTGFFMTMDSDFLPLPGTGMNNTAVSLDEPRHAPVLR